MYYLIFIMLKINKCKYYISNIICTHNGKKLIFHINKICIMYLIGKYTNCMEAHLCFEVGNRRKE